MANSIYDDNGTGDSLLKAEKNASDSPEDPSDNSGKDAPTTKELSQAEDTPGRQLYSGGQNKKKKISLRKRIGLAAGLAGFGGGGILFLAIVTLPSLKIMHLAEVLKLDLSSNEESSNKSLNRLFRYARSDNVGSTRVSWLGERVFKSARAQLSDIGITIQANEKFSNIKTITFDLTKNPELKNMTRDQARTFLADKFKDIKITEADIKNVSDTKLTINSRRVGISATRFILKSSLSQLEGGKIASAIRMRNITKFYNLPSIFHPWKRVDAKFDNWIAARAEARAREKARKARVSKYSSPKAQAAKAALKARWSGISRVAGGTLLLTGVVCMIRDSAEDVVVYNREAIALPAVVDAAEMMAMGSQLQAGTDFGPSQLSDALTLLGDSKGGDVFNSLPLRAKIDPLERYGIDLPIEYVQAFGGTTARTLKDLGGDAGAAACSDIGQSLQIVGGLALLLGSIPTGGGSGVVYAGIKTVASVAIGAAVMAGVQHLITAWLETDPWPEDMTAEVKGGMLAYGSRELAAINARSGGGIDLGSSTSAELDVRAALASQQEFQSKSVFARVFDATDHRSLAGILIDKQSTNPSQQLQTIAAGLFNFRLLFSSITNIFSSPLVHAADAKPYNWGSNRYGIPSRIIDNPAYDDPYANADFVASNILNVKSVRDEYLDRAKRCFGVTISQINNFWAVTPQNDVNPNDSEYEKGRCNEGGEKWDRLMLFIHDSSNMEATACFEGDTEACGIITGRPQ